MSFPSENSERCGTFRVQFCKRGLPLFKEFEDSKSLGGLWVPAVLYSSNNWVCMAAWIRMLICQSLLLTPSLAVYPGCSFLGYLVDMCRALCCHCHQGIDRLPQRAVAGVRIQVCPLHSPERQKNRISTSEMTEGQRREYAEN